MCRKKAARGCVTASDMGNMGKVSLSIMSDIDVFLLIQGFRYPKYPGVMCGKWEVSQRAPFGHRRAYPDTRGGGWQEPRLGC